MEHLGYVTNVSSFMKHLGYVTERQKFYGTFGLCDRTSVALWNIWDSDIPQTSYTNKVGLYFAQNLKNTYSSVLHKH